VLGGIAIPQEGRGWRSYDNPSASGGSQELYVPTTSSTSLFESACNGIAELIESSQKSIAEDASLIPLENVMAVGKALCTMPERPSPRLMVCPYPGVEVRSAI